MLVRIEAIYSTRNRTRIRKTVQGIRKTKDLDTKSWNQKFVYIQYIYKTKDL